MKPPRLTILCGFLAARLAAQDSYTITWSTIDGGGSTTPSVGEITLAGATVGQADAGVPGGLPGAFAIEGGFWAGVSAAGGADPSVIASDDFTYPDGPASDQSGGTGKWTGRWIGFGFWVVDGRLDGSSSMPVNFNRLRREFTNSETSPELFVSFDLTTPAAVGLDDFAVASLLSIEFTYPASLVFGKWPGSNEFVLGPRQASTGVTIQPGTTHHIVGAYDIDQGVWSLWVDPDGTDNYDPATGAGSADATLTGVLNIRPAYLLSLDTSKPGYAIDNLVISDGPGSVGLTLPPPPDPSPDDLEPEITLNQATLTLSWHDLGVPVIVERSDDLLNWTPVDPQPTEPAFSEAVTPGRHFYRLSIPPR